MITQENPVRLLHNSVAPNPDPVVASTRSLDVTEFELWLMKRDVARKLQVDATTTVLELGCGIGLLSAHLAQFSLSVTGVDFAEKAVERFNRLDLPNVRGLVGDVVNFRAEQLFDRVLLYATLHLARTDDEAQAILKTCMANCKRGGRILVGNIPLDEFTLDCEYYFHNKWKWVRQGNRTMGRNWRWRLGGLCYRVLKKLFLRMPSRQPLVLPPGYEGFVRLDRQKIEDWLQRWGVSYRWLRPAIGIPQYLSRADLVIFPAGGPP